MKNELHRLCCAIGSKPLPVSPMSTTAEMVNAKFWVIESIKSKVPIVYGEKKGDNFFFESFKSLYPQIFGRMDRYKDGTEKQPDNETISVRIENKERVFGAEAGAMLRESILKIQECLLPPEQRKKLPIRQGKGWRSLNTVGMVRAQQIEQNLSFHRGRKGLGDLYPDGEKLWQLMHAPLSKKELLQYYNRNAKFKGNNRKLKNKFL